MNWNTYKQLSEEDIEEYQYKFGEGPDTTNWYMFAGIIGTGLIFFHLFLFYVIAISTNETLMKFREAVGEVVVQDLKVIVVIMWLIVFSLLYNAIQNIVYAVRRKRWLKNHNITITWRDLWK
jgi:hypothetical protein